MPLAVGETAPEFDVTAHDGRQLRLADFRGKKNVVLYFYPRDFTLVCTKEACGFRDMYEDLASSDTEVIGVSVDSDERHQAFSREHNVRFPLVADRQRELARRYKAVGLFDEVLGTTARVTYVIDRSGQIAGVFESRIRADQHLDGVRKTIGALTKAT